MTDDATFAAAIADRVAGVPGVLAVTLGGSRGQGIHRPDSDWDFGLYYRGRLDPDDVRALGWSGQVFAPGEWGGGVMNGGAWLTVHDRRVDLHYRDLDEVEHWTAEADRGRFDVQQLLCYVAGIPTYVLPGELALSQVLIGDLPRPAYSRALREEASRRWREVARLTLDYAEGAYGRHREPVVATALVTQAVIQIAHARLAAHGTWVLNEKRIVRQAGLAHLGRPLPRPGGTADGVAEAIATARAQLS